MRGETRGNYIIFRAGFVQNSVITGDSRRVEDAGPQFRGGAPDLKERRLPTGRKHDASRPGRKPTLHDTIQETLAD